MADKVEYGKERDVEGAHRKTPGASGSVAEHEKRLNEHDVLIGSHRDRLSAIEKHVGFDKKAKTPDEKMRGRKRH